MPRTRPLRKLSSDKAAELLALCGIDERVPYDQLDGVQIAALYNAMPLARYQGERLSKMYGKPPARMFHAYLLLALRDSSGRASSRGRAARPPTYTVQAGRAILRNGVHIFSIWAPPRKIANPDLSWAELDAYVRRIAALLNKSEGEQP